MHNRTWLQHVGSRVTAYVHVGLCAVVHSLGMGIGPLHWVFGLEGQVVPSVLCSVCGGVYVSLLVVLH